MNIVGAKKVYNGEWWNDMMALPKPFLVAALERANRRADKAEESAPTSHNNARDEIAALANELEDFNSHRVAPYGRITEIVAKMRQLSPVA